MSAEAHPVTTDSYFKRHWRGELSLPKSYWINGVLIWGLGINILCVVLLTVSLIAFFGHPVLVIVVCLAEIAVQVTAYIWALVGTWRAAGRYRGPKFWSVLARIAMAIGVLISIGNVSKDFRAIGLAANAVGSYR
jgi:hypothetical protein